MPDSEVFKVLLQLGSFGLLSVIAIWLLWKGAPMLRDSLGRISTDHRAVVEKLTTDCSTERKEMREWLSEEMNKRDETYGQLATAVTGLTASIDCRRRTS